jgi:hypothetical protein
MFEVATDLVIINNGENRLSLWSETANVIATASEEVAHPL